MEHLPKKDVCKKNYFQSLCKFALFTYFIIMMDHSCFEKLKLMVS